MRGMERTAPQSARDPAGGSKPSRAAGALKSVAWLLLVLAILQRYVIRLGDSPRDVDVAAAGLLLVALAARVIAWRTGRPPAG